jgi:hypothetical protein
METDEAPGPPIRRLGVVAARPRIGTAPGAALLRRSKAQSKPWFRAIGRAAVRVNGAEGQS